MSTFMGYEISDIRPTNCGVSFGETTLSEMAPASESVNGDDLAILYVDGPEGRTWLDFVNGTMRNISASMQDGEFYSLRRENDYQFTRGSLCRVS